MPHSNNFKLQFFEFDKKSTNIAFENAQKNSIFEKHVIIKKKLDKVFGQLFGKDNLKIIQTQINI